MRITDICSKAKMKGRLDICWCSSHVPTSGGGHFDICAPRGATQKLQIQIRRECGGVMQILNGEGGPNWLKAVQSMPFHKGSGPKACTCVP